MSLPGKHETKEIVRTLQDYVKQTPDFPPAPPEMWLGDSEHFCEKGSRIRHHCDIIVTSLMQMWATKWQFQLSSLQPEPGRTFAGMAELFGPVGPVGENFGDLGSVTGGSKSAGSRHLSLQNLAGFITWNVKNPRKKPLFFADLFLNIANSLTWFILDHPYHPISFRGWICYAVQRQTMANLWQNRSRNLPSSLWRRWSVQPCFNLPRGILEGLFIHLQNVAEYHRISFSQRYSVHWCSLNILQLQLRSIGLLFMTFHIFHSTCLTFSWHFRPCFVAHLTSTAARSAARTLDHARLVLAAQSLNLRLFCDLPRKMKQKITKDNKSTLDNMCVCVCVCVFKVYFDVFCIF